MRECAAKRERAGVSGDGASPNESVEQAIAESARRLPKDRCEIPDDAGALRLNGFEIVLEMETRGCDANSEMSDGISAVA
jgi:hypothetical protein